MKRFLEELRDFRKKGDMVLLILCLVVAGFGLVAVASATSAEKFGSNLRYLIIQAAAIGLGVFMYALVSSVDLDFLSEHRMLLVAFNVLMLLLLIPFGTDNDTGNRSWLKFPLFPVMIQPAEICKITYIIIMASVMAEHQNTVSHPISVAHMLFHLGLLVGENMALSKDMGVSLIFVFIFIGMTFTGGVSLWWFAAAGGSLVTAAPFIWSNVLAEHQKNRIRILFDETVDPQGINERYHAKINLQSITGGGLTGQGLFNGNRTQGGNLFAQHTDYIFSSMGEEIGFVGCVIIMLLELAIIARCIYVGVQCQGYMRRLVCFGAASAMMFQVTINVGMCIGVMPVIGLTLPLISYGGSSVVTIFTMLGFVSGAHARPQSMSHERYVQPYRG